MTAKLNLDLVGKLDVLPPLNYTFVHLPVGYAATLFFDPVSSAAADCPLA